MFFSKFFKKKTATITPAVLPDLPALNAWGIFFQGHGIALYSRNAASIPGTESEFIYLKSYPELFELERKLFAQWLTLSSTGIYLQQQENDAASWLLLYINFNDPQVRVIKTGITPARWSSGYEDGRPTIVIKGQETIFID